MNRAKWIWLGCLGLIYASFWIWYGGNGDPISEEEGLEMLAEVERIHGVRLEDTPEGSMSRNLRDMLPNDDGKEFYAKEDVGAVLPDRDASIVVDMDLVRTQDATVRPIVTGTTSIDEILEAETQLALAVFEALGVTLTPAEREAVVRRPTRDLGALLAFGQASQAEAEGRIYVAIQGYRDGQRSYPSWRRTRDQLFYCAEVRRCPGADRPGRHSAALPPVAWQSRCLCLPRRSP